MIIYIGHGVYSSGKTYGIDVDGEALIPLDDLIQTASLNPNVLTISVL